MALLDFEHFNRETNLSLSNWLSWSGGGSAVSADGLGPFSYGRFCTGGIGRFSAFSLTTEIIANFHFFYTGLPGTNAQIWAFKQATSDQAGLQVSPTGTIRITRGASTLVAETTGFTLSINAWHFVQIRMNLQTSGSYELRVNGKTIISGSGNLQALGSAGADGWIFPSGYRIANLIVYSTVGANPNTFTPETRIYADLANADGSVSGWTRSGGSANFDRINEQPNNGDTSYNSAGSAVLDDLYAFASSIPGGSTVYGVANEIVARKDDAGVNDVQCLIRSGGTTYADGVSKALSTSYQRFRNVWTTDPATGLAWTVTNANAAQAGIRRSA